MSTNPNNPTTINVHGFARTEQFRSYDEWTSYVSKRIDDIISQNNSYSFGGRMTISEFLSKPQFAESQFTGKVPETRRVKDKFNDPLPPYDQYLGNGFVRNGLRRSVDYLTTQRAIRWEDVPWDPFTGFGDNVSQINKRREWGFREKVLDGYPEYKPWMADNDLKNEPWRSKIIFGVVTAGSGVFGGIQSISGISPNSTELLRSAELGPGRATDTPFVPTGLCFIQDETGGLGIALGTDIRYVYHPSVYKTNFANPVVDMDQMHAGSIVIPKADYRQFLRVGDFVAIEVGVNFKYWHSVLGVQPRHWEELYAPNYGEEFDIGYSQERNGKKPYVDNWGGHQFPYSNLEYVLPNQLGRDGAPRGVWNRVTTLGNVGYQQQDTYGYYPYQEDHPWSTGTPIPVNTGMPYVMMQQFIVDNRDRISPAPLVVTNSDLRGFPKLGTVFSDGYVLNDISRLGEVNPDTAWLYEETPPNPWTENAGSVYKGMLIQLKNVRFVQPPKKKMYRVRLATSEGRTLADGSVIYSVNGLLNEINRVNELLASGIPINEITVPFLGTRGIRDLNFSGFENYNRILESIMSNNFVDARGFLFIDDPLDLYGRLNGNFGPADSFDFLLTSFILDTIISVADFFTFGIAGKILHLIPGLFPETPGWDFWDKDIDFSKYLQYETIEVDSPFPKSVDDQDGGYWWATPTIPLTNANSHYKDYKDTTGFLDARRNQFTQLISSNKLPEVEDRYVRDLGHLYSSSYAPWAEEWKPSKMVNGQLVYNTFEPVLPNSYFIGNKIYYVVDENNVVVPIRINSNTEIARFNLPIPTGSCDITGIAWQYSLGKPGLEWEREAYVMQVWPRFSSDILEYRTLPDSRDRKIGDGEVQGVETDTPILLKDNSFDIGDSIPLESIGSLNCDRLNDALDPRDPNAPCNVLKNNEEQYLIVRSSQLWYGLTRIFKFSKDSSGNCTCEGPLPSNTITNP